MRHVNPKPLDPDVLEILEIEKAEPWAPEEAKARVLQRVASTISGASDNGTRGGGDSGGEARAMSSGSALPRPGGIARPLSLAVAFGLGSVAGIVAERAMHHPVSHQAVKVSQPALPVPASPSSADSVGIAGPAVSNPPLPSTAVASSESRGAPLAAERALLDGARAAFGRGDGEEALAALSKHEKLYPKGQLAEEREALAVRALVLTQRFEEARARGARFRKRYPASVMLPAVEAALGSIPAGP